MADLKSQIMVFEDLSEQNFKNSNKADGLDSVHMEFVLSMLAKWHAATSILLLKVKFRP